MPAWLKAAQVFQRDNESHHAVSAHSEVTDIVEEHDAGRARRVCRLTKKRADEHVRTARFVDDSRTETIMLFAQNLQTVSHAAATKFGSSTHDDACRFPGRVRVDDLNSFQAGFLVVDS